jgi:oxaloacetate decarboxylase alpha subunit
MSEINLIDVTLRDAHQSLWSTRMTNAMIAPALSLLEQVGFHTIDICGGAVFDVCVRYLRENPWQRLRMITGVLHRTSTNVWIRGQSLFTFELFPDDVVAETVRHIAACGVRNITTYDALNDVRNVETSVRAGHAAGLSVTGAIVYTFSPVHTDSYYRERAKELLALNVDRLCIKDPSGLLTPERIRNLAPVMLEVAGKVPVELHSHCLSTLAPQVYCDALDRGIRYFHTAVSPLANGASLPAAEDLIREAHRRQHTIPVDASRLKEMADYFTWVALSHDKPLGRPARYDPALYEHQVPGGMISNLKAQLESAKLGRHLHKVLEEVSRVRQDLGYPIMVSPFAQFLITQATLNVVQGETRSGNMRLATMVVRRRRLSPISSTAQPTAPILSRHDPQTSWRPDCPKHARSEALFEMTIICCSPPITMTPSSSRCRRPIAMELARCVSSQARSSNSWTISGKTKGFVRHG